MELDKRKEEPVAGGGKTGEGEQKLEKLNRKGSKEVCV